MEQYDVMTQTRAYERDVVVYDEDYDSTYDEKLELMSQIAAKRIPPQPILEPDEDLRQAITVEELLVGIHEDIDKFYDKLNADKCKY